MAAEADKVVVELIANVDKFNADIKTSTTGFTASMGQMEKAAAGAETAHKKVGLAANNNRIAMLELQHVVRGSTDQFAAGAPLTQIFAQHVASISEAAVLAGGSLGKLGAFLGGPFGLAVTASVGIIATLIAKHKDEGDTVDSLVEKLKHHAEQARLQGDANNIWAKSIDGLLDSLKKLDDELVKQIGLTEKTPQDKLAEAITKRNDAQAKFNSALAHQLELEKSLAKVRSSVPSAPPAAGAPGVVVDPGAKARTQQIDQLTKALADQRIEVAKTTRAVVLSQKAVADASVAVAQSVGDATSEATTHIEDLAKLLRTKVARAGTLLLDPQDVAAATTALDDYKAAEDAAAAKGLDFAKIGAESEVKKLTDSFARGITPVDAYTKRIEALAAALQDAAEKAKQDPIKTFKQNLIGAEGLGQNPQSSAAGFGQFLAQKPGQPATEWQSYFKQVFARQASEMTAAEIDALRTKRPIAEAIIDRATDDYVALLKKMGQDISAANLYAVHVLGAPDAKKFFAASPNQSVLSALGGGAHAQAVVDKNGSLFTGTVAQAQAQLAKRIGDSSTTISAGVAALAQLQQQEKEREAQYVAAKDEAERQVIEARKGLAKTAEDIWSFETAANIAAKKHTDDQIAAQQAAGKLLPQEAIELKKINDERAKYRQLLTDQRLREAQFALNEANFQRGNEFQTASYRAEAEVLQSQEGLARNAKDRRKIEQRLIDLQFAEEKLRNQYIIDWAERVKANKDATDKEKADAQLAEDIAKLHQGTLDERHSNATQGNDRSNASPLQSFFNSIPQTATDINAAFEQIAANGLQTFNDSLANAIVNFTSLRDVARTVLAQIATDLIKLALQQIEMHTIGAALGAASTASTTAFAAAAGAAWAGPAALASLATLGTNAGPAAAALTATVGLATILGTPKAQGGRIRGPGTTTSDSILTPSSVDEFMIRAVSAKSVGYDTLDYINRTGRLPDVIRPSNAQAFQASSGRGGIGPADIRRLEAAIDRSRSDVSLYAGIDPVEMFQRALGHPAGERALFATLSSNATRVKAAINRPGS
jgi:hypothetical protein